jgi:hypothetical protein
MNALSRKAAIWLSAAATIVTLVSSPVSAAELGDASANRMTAPEAADIDFGNETIVVTGMVTRSTSAPHRP